MTPFLLVLVSAFSLAVADSTTDSPIIRQGLKDYSLGKFFIHTKNFPEGVEINIFEDYSGEHIKQKTGVKLITHGYFRTKNTYQHVVNKYLESTEFTIMSFEWQELARLNETEAAVTAISLGSSIISSFLNELKKKFMFTEDMIHLIGDGLGAHMMGAAGRAQQGKLSRITGLDPHKKLFDGNSTINLPGLGPGDARFVDAYHTYIEQADIQFGVADFYASGGNYEPKCTDTRKEFCNDFMSIDYFAESIENRNYYIARKCSSFEDFIKGLCNKNPTAVAGEYVTLTAEGKYYFQTRINPPYGKQENGSVPCHFVM